jgi:hypothetical protein
MGGIKGAKPVAEFEDPLDWTGVTEVVENEY